MSLAVTVGPGAGLRGGGGMVGGFKFDTTVQVLNGGPLPVTVEAVSTTVGAVTLSGSDLDTLVAPGATADVAVQLRQDCPRWLATEPATPLDVRLDVITADGTQHSQTRYLDPRITPWYATLQTNCPT